MADILLVDDHPDVRDVVGQLLEMNGHTVRFLPTGEKALQTLEAHRPDLIVSDNRLPGMNGIELLKKIRADQRFSDIRLVLCSADDTVREDALDAGADAFWLKGSDTLFDSIAQLKTTLLK